MNAQTKNQYAMQDPTKQYPQPKFEEQPQSVPGLARDIGNRGAAHGRVLTGGNDPFSRFNRHGPNYIDPQSFCILATEGKNDARARRRVIPRPPAPTEGCR